jgi:hypothetical protein
MSINAITSYLPSAKGVKSFCSKAVSIPTNIFLKVRSSAQSKPDWYISPLGFEATKAVFHLADKKGALTIAYKVALFVTLFLPALAVIDFTVGNAVRWTVGNIVVAAKRKVINQIAKNPKYVWSPAKIAIIATLALTAGVSFYASKNNWFQPPTTPVQEVVLGSTPYAWKQIASVAVGGVSIPTLAMIWGISRCAKKTLIPPPVTVKG